jgi:hypothetical protein
MKEKKKRKGKEDEREDGGVCKSIPVVNNLLPGKLPGTKDCPHLVLMWQ